MNELSLFSGYGGFTLGLRLAGLDVRTVGYVEIEPYCQEIIKARIKDGYLDDAPIWDDIRTFRGEQFRGLVDIVTAGFPCQPHSTAGQRRGEADERNLWPDTLRVIGEVGPPWVLLENVPGILAKGYAGTVVGQLSESGYECRWGVVSARDVGATHWRDRWWCLAYAGCEHEYIQQRFYGAESAASGKRLALPQGISGTLRPAAGERQGRPSGSDVELAHTSSSRSTEQERQHQEMGRVELSDGNGGGRELGNPTGAGLSEHELQQAPMGEQGQKSELIRASSRTPGTWPPGPTERDRWAGILREWPSLEPAVRGVANGTPHRVDRLKALGNGVVPAVVVEFLWRVGMQGKRREIP